MFSRRRCLLPFLIVLVTPIAVIAQNVHAGCNEIPREDALASACVPPTSEILAQKQPDSVILLNVPAGTSLRVTIDQKVRIAKPGQAISAKLAEPVYAFDQPVIPAGSEVTGRVTSIGSVPAKTKVLAYVNGNFSPSRKYELEFDSVVLPGGERRTIATTVSPGIAQVVHLTPGNEKEKKIPQREKILKKLRGSNYFFNSTGN